MQSFSVKAVSKLSSGSAVAQLVSLVCLATLTRIYSTADFGDLALVVSLSVLLSVIASGRYESAVMNPGDENEAAWIIISSICLSFVICGSTLTIMLLFSAVFDSISSNSIALYSAVPITAMLNSWYNIARKWSNRLHGYSAMSISTIVVPFVGNGGGILLAYLIPNPGAIELVISYAAGQAAGITILLFFTGATLLKRIRYFSKQRIVHILQKYSQFPAFTVPHSLASKAVTEIPVFFLSAFFGADAAGIFSVARRALNQPMLLLANNIGQLFHRRIAGDKTQNGTDLTHELNLILLVMSLLTIPVVIIILIFGKPLFHLVFGIQFVNAALFAQILSPALAMRMLAAPIAHIFLVLNHQRSMMLLQFLHLALILFAYLFGNWTENIHFVLALQSLGSCIAYGLVVFFARRIVTTRSQLPLS